MAPEVITTIVTAVIAAVATLGKVLFSFVRKNTERLEQKLDECEGKHEAANDQRQDQAERISRLEGFHDGLKAGSHHDWTRPRVQAESKTN